MDHSTQIDPAEIVDSAEPQDSTVIDQDKSPEEPNQHKALSRDDAIDKAIADAEKEAEAQDEEDGEDIPEKEEKPAKNEGKKEEPDAEKDDDKSDDDDDGSDDDEDEEPVKKEGPKQKAADKFIKAPDKFLPDAKEVWHNTPHIVRRDIENMVREHKAEIQQAREVSERYEAIRDFDELARQNGRDLRESLIRVNQIENMLQSNPIAGLNQILLEAGPRKPDGQAISLFELAQFVVQKGQQGYHEMVRAQPQQQQQGQQQASPEVEQLRQQVAQMREQQVAATVIEPFKAEHPRFDELSNDIAFFLNSGKIPQGLSPVDRLAAAYDMAARINPGSNVEQAAQEETEPAQTEPRVVKNSGGSPSTRGAPPSGAKNGSKARRALSKDDAIDKAMSAVFG